MCRACSDVVMGSGRVYCWGNNARGQLGTGNTDDSQLPVLSNGGRLFTDIRAGDGYACGIATATTVFCWGSNSEGQLGNDLVNYSATPLQIPAPVAGLLRQARLSAAPTPRLLRPH